MPKLPPIISLLEPPAKVPAVLVQSLVKVWVSPAPRLSVPVPVIMSAAPPTFPVKVATPGVLFAIKTFPVVMNPVILLVPDPAIVILELPGVNVPELPKAPPKVIG